MNKAVEDRARAQCALDARMRGCGRRLPGVVERLWPVAAREMMGVLDLEALAEPPDLAQREAEYRKIKRTLQGAASGANARTRFSVYCVVAADVRSIHSQ